MSQNIKHDLIQFITESFMVEEDEIDFDASLVDQGIIDSIGLIEITSFIEKQYGISIDESNLTRENFGSANKIAAFIGKMMESKEH